MSVIGIMVRDTKNVYRQLKCLGICLRTRTPITKYIPSEWRLLLLDETKNIPHINLKQIKLNANISRYLLWHVVILSCLKHYTRCVCTALTVVVPYDSLIIYLSILYVNIIKTSFYILIS